MSQNIRVLSNGEYSGGFEDLDRPINYSTLEVTPYLNDKLIQGYVIFNNGDSATYFMRYDIYADEIEYVQNNKLFTILKPQMQKLDHIILDHNKIVYKDFHINKNGQSGYLIQLVTNQCNLYQRHFAEYKDAIPAKTGMHKPTPAQFKKKPVQWLFACDSDPIYVFRTDNSGLKKIGGVYYQQLKDYINENHLKIKKTDDMITLFNFLNSLKGE